MTWIEDEEFDITPQKLVDLKLKNPTWDVEDMNDELYTVLCYKTTAGRAKDKVMLLKDEVKINGACCYWAFSRELTGSSASQVMAMSLKLNNPVRLKGHANLEARMIEFEGDCALLERRAGQEILWGMRMAMLMSWLPTDLFVDAQKLKDPKYEDLAELVANSVRMGRSWQKPGGGLDGLDRSGGGDDYGGAGAGGGQEEQWSVEQWAQYIEDESNGDGGGQGGHEADLNTWYSGGGKKGGGKKGKGGSGGAGKGAPKGGGGKFEGKCNHCGVPGHMKYQCRKLDAEMNAYRLKNGIVKGDNGGGKGSPGGSRAGGKGTMNYAGGQGDWWNKPEQGVATPAMPGFGGRFFNLSVDPILGPVPNPVTIVNRYAALEPEKSKIIDDNSETEAEEEAQTDVDKLTAVLRKFGKVVTAKGRLGRRIRARSEKKSLKGIEDKTFDEDVRHHNSIIGNVCSSTPTIESAAPIREHDGSEERQLPPPTGCSRNKSR